MIQKIVDDTLIKCPNCGKAELAIAWDAFTEEQCLDRDMRRHYIHITDSKALKKMGKISKYSYCCPNCQKYIKINMLIKDKDAY